MQTGRRWARLERAPRRADDQVRDGFLPPGHAQPQAAQPPGRRGHVRLPGRHCAGPQQAASSGRGLWLAQDAR